MFPSEYQGDLFFGDYAKGFIKTPTSTPNGDITAVHDFDDQAGSVVDLKVAPDGSLYYITYYPGALYRVTYNTASHLPVASASADVTKGLEPLTVHFSSAGSRDPDGDPLSYHWDLRRRDDQHRAEPDQDLRGEGRLHRAPHRLGRQATSASAQPIVIQVGVATRPDRVAAPTEGQLYRAGDTITYNAFASDAAGFDLNDARHQDRGQAAPRHALPPVRRAR